MRLECRTLCFEPDRTAETPARMRNLSRHLTRPYAVTTCLKPEVRIEEVTKRLNWDRRNDKNVRLPFLLPRVAKRVVSAPSHQSSMDSQH